MFDYDSLVCLVYMSAELNATWKTEAPIACGYQCIFLYTIKLLLLPHSVRTPIFTVLFILFQLQVI